MVIQGGHLATSKAASSIKHWGAWDGEMGMCFLFSHPIHQGDKALFSGSGIEIGGSWVGFGAILLGQYLLRETAVSLQQPWGQRIWARE